MTIDRATRDPFQVRSLERRDRLVQAADAVRELDIDISLKAALSTVLRKMAPRSIPVVVDAAGTVDTEGHLDIAPKVDYLHRDIEQLVWAVLHARWAAAKRNAREVGSTLDGAELEAETEAPVRPEAATRVRVHYDASRVLRWPDGTRVDRTVSIRCDAPDEYTASDTDFAARHDGT